MQISTIAMQVVLPILLLAWLAMLPAAGVLAYAVQAVSVGAVLLGLGLVALWVVPPWWVPYFYGLIFCLIVGRHLLRRRVGGTGMWSETIPGSIALIAGAGLGLLAANLAAQALAGRRLPPVETVNIAAPFATGTYLVAHGGSTEVVNVHLRTLDPTVERYGPWRGQSRALDLIRITPAGMRSDGWHPADPARYQTFGTPVLTPCAGTVAVAVDGVADMPVPEMDREHMAGNFVAIDCGGFAVILAHLRNGSLRVAAGDTLETGDPIGQMGNSGNSSEPHLHVHAQRGIPDGAPLGGEPLGLTIDGRFHVRNDRISIGEP